MSFKTKAEARAAIETLRQIGPKARFGLVRDYPTGFFIEVFNTRGEGVSCVYPENGHLSVTTKILKSIGGERGALQPCRSIFPAATRVKA
jgi:hypothetical protein